ncbi:hypothetical protein [Paenibacillus elgii]|uniref:hypothetical protein n=1 Tax=Paenibacillus elgii TaxID=189691 RepID=UPI000248E084|nr:hypothetical protein [Paenibacillus elgii]
MSFDQEINTLILRYLHDKYHDQYAEWTIENIRVQPRWRRVWAFWEAKCHYEQNGHFQQLENAPPGLPSVWVMERGENVNYRWDANAGEYVFLQKVTKEECKAIYGEF